MNRLFQKEIKEVNTAQKYSMQSATWGESRKISSVYLTNQIVYGAQPSSRNLLYFALKIYAEARVNEREKEKYDSSAMTFTVLA